MFNRLSRLWGRKAGGGCRWDVLRGGRGYKSRDAFVYGDGGTAMLRSKRGSIRPRRGRHAALGEGGDRQREPLCTASLYEDAQADEGRGMSNKGRDASASPSGH